MIELMVPRTAPHVERRLAPPSLAPLLAGALDEIDYGVLLADGQGNVLHANHPARLTLTNEHPLALVGGRLRARDGRDLAPLHDALQAAAQRQWRRLLTLGHDAAPQVVAVVPVGDQIAAVVLGKTQVCAQLSIQCFARSHALTPAETRVLAALGAGAAPAEIATHQGVKLSTVRTQIGAIRDKTGVSSITALVRLVAALPPMVSCLRH